MISLVIGGQIIKLLLVSLLFCFFLRNGENFGESFFEGFNRLICSEIQEKVGRYRGRFCERYHYSYANKQMVRSPCLYCFLEVKDFERS